jgi:hypothetical protein
MDARVLVLGRSLAESVLGMDPFPGEEWRFDLGFTDYSLTKTLNFLNLMALKVTVL